MLNTRRAAITLGLAKLRKSRENSIKLRVTVFLPVLPRSLSPLTPQWLEGTFLHVSCTAPHRELPGAL